MPVLALATTEAYRAVPPEAGAISMDVDELVQAARILIADPDEARARGAAARRFALERYGLQRFLDDWDRVLARVAR
jgi:glycosyltransferase involved in cell wall biosynthesis